jgi:hypothetical protein
MREQPRREWLPAAKRKWVSPAVRELELTEDFLRLFGVIEPIANALETCGANGRSSGRSR